MGKVERGMQAPANAVYFSIFYCGCKQLKSIHLEIRCKGTNFRTKCKIIFKFLRCRVASIPFCVKKWRRPSRVASQKVSKSMIGIILSLSQR